jgi:hypothetical protein
MVAQTVRIGVVSDLHYTHPSLIVERGKALDTYLNGDRKLLLESDALILLFTTITVMTRLSAVMHIL